MHTPETDQIPAVLIVGSMAFDDLELPSTSATDVVGGSATYAALAASLFAPARVVAIVGRDFPESTFAELRGRGVDMQGVIRADGRTFRWSGRYASDLSSRTTLDTQLNVFAHFRPKLPAAYQDSQIVLLGNIHPELQLEVLDQVRAPRIVAADTMNYWIDGERPALLRVLARIDTLIINDEELRQLAGQHNIRLAARAVQELGPQRLIVKRGEHGALLFDETGVFVVPAFPLDTEIDPTGAGDTFAGALLGHLATRLTNDAPDLRLSLLTAAAVASFCVQGVGTTRLTALDRSQLAERISELRSLIDVRD
ncbi:MAG: sugar kinase [Polyangiaceae bacterium]|nr:sugar kinase [Polyangiaceae bacterium]